MVDRGIVTKGALCHVDPHGGFSPVRLQMDRQWRPSTRSQGLSAVHMRPMTPSYTPPQLQLPGVRDPVGITRSRTSRFNVARLPATPTRPSRGPWLTIGLCCPVGSSLTTASSAPLDSSPPLMDSRRRLLHPRISAWGGNPEVPQFTPLDCARVPPPLPRWPRRVRMTVASSSVLAFTC